MERVHVQIQENAQEADDLTAGARLERLLYELRLSQTDLARQTGKSPQYVNNIIRQGQGITENYARTLGEITGVNLNWLLIGVGPMLRCDVTVSNGPSDKDSSAIGLIQKASQMLQRAADEIAPSAE